MKPSGTFPPVFTASLAVMAGGAAVYVSGITAAAWTAALALGGGIFRFRGIHRHRLHLALLAAGFCAGGAAMGRKIAACDADVKSIGINREVSSAVLVVRDNGCSPLCPWMDTP